jgi:phage terminase Nu1 subunit (DNA packaging protein)
MPRRPSPPGQPPDPPPEAVVVPFRRPGAALGAPDVVRLEVTAEGLAAVLGLSRQRIGQLVAEGVVPKHARGAYPLCQAVQSVVQTARANGGPGRKVADADARWKIARARQAEANVAALEGRLLPREAVAATWGKMTGAIRARLLEMPRSLGPDLARAQTAEEASTLLKDALYRVLSAIAEDPVYADDESIPGVDLVDRQGDDEEPSSSA